MRGGIWHAGNMFAIHFKSKASKEQAVRCLTGKVQFKDGKPGALVVNEDAVVLLTARGIPFVRSCTDVIPVANEQPVFVGGFAC